MAKLALDWIFDHRWAITPSALENIISIASRETMIDSVVDAALKSAVAEERAIAARDAEPLPGARRAEVRDGVAIIPITGPIFPRATMFSMISGATSISTLSKDLQIALDDPQVHSIVFNIDSPGGEVTGVSEFSNMIFAARGQKPMISYVYGMAASAAYWIGSAADLMILADTAEAGSIGVVSAWTDTRERDAKSGVKTHEIVSSVSPNKRPDPATDVGRGQIQALVDELAGIFVGAVARNRGVTADDVVQKFGRGGLLVGSSAVKAGMADSVGSFESEVMGLIDNNSPSFPLYAGKETGMNVELLQKQHPDVYAAVIAKGKEQAIEENKAAVTAARAEGKAEGVTAERARIQGIASVKSPGYEKLISEQMFSPEATMESVAVAILAAQNAKVEEAAKAHAEDGKEVAAQVGGMGGAPENMADAAMNAKISSAVEKIKGVRK